VRDLTITAGLQDTLTALATQEAAGRGIQKACHYKSQNNKISLLLTESIGMEHGALSERRNVAARDGLRGGKKSRIAYCVVLRR
jgi:hypothetical protein